MNNDPKEIKSYEYTFYKQMLDQQNFLEITIIAYSNIDIEPYIKVYKKIDDKEYMCRLSLLHSKYIGLEDENLILSCDDIYILYDMIKLSPFNIYAMFAHTLEEDLDPYLSDIKKDDILEERYGISNRNYKNFKIPNYFGLLIGTISTSETFGSNTIQL